MKTLQKYIIMGEKKMTDKIIAEYGRWHPKKEKLVWEQTSPYKPYHHENFLTYIGRIILSLFATQR